MYLCVDFKILIPLCFGKRIWSDQEFGFVQTCFTDSTQSIFVTFMYVWKSVHSIKVVSCINAHLLDHIFYCVIYVHCVLSVFQIKPFTIHKYAYPSMFQVYIITNTYLREMYLISVSGFTEFFFIFLCFLYVF